ncbi:thioredoxin-like domain-containing protein [Tenacibaculum pacificus]|uniref:TlpA family protein disulfide reductase n=1 Tax=Tenacibaculum pacificus TaxID=3018314 RepID=UPI0022F39BA3|nr:thioredoxin-like domain-containing protein [Tenacibaculum pacificus]WBX73186.1 thioredoxin-like domain-containing protein [Tenacibaculum pacificus]
MKYFLCFIVFLILQSCAVFQPKSFTNEALDEKLVTITRDSITLKEIFENNKGKQQLIQVFATYCPFSQRSFKDVIKFQKENPSFKYVFLSVDHSYFDWKRGLENIKVKGQHYYIPKKGKGKLAKFLKLKTIPRFMIVDKKGEISLFKASSVSKKVNNKY